MNCEHCQSHLSAHIDNELSESLQEEVRLHLQTCEDCRVELEDLRAVDARLRVLRLPHRNTDNGSQVPEGSADLSLSESPGSDNHPSRFRWTGGRALPWTIVAAIAASILIAIVAIPERDPKSKPSTELTIAGRLVRATGSVEVLVPGSGQWQRIDGANEIHFQSGSRIRTCESVACEIELAENATLRMNEAAELILHEPSRVEVVKGQVWSRASQSTPLRVDTNSPDGSNSIPISMVCPSDSEFQWNIDQRETACLSLAGQQTQWKSIYVDCEVTPGERVAIDVQHNVRRSKQNSSATKIWQLPLLATSETLDHELAEILESLLVQIGSTKAGYLRENEIRQLGPAGAIPLLAYVQSADSREQTAVRRHAMRIAAEMVDEQAVTRLQQLCDDDDQAIATLAKRALATLE